VTPTPTKSLTSRAILPEFGTSTRRHKAFGYAVLAFLAYLPAFLSDPGKVSADTKNYLYLDPGRLLERAPYMWDPHIGLGTVTHQNIGYLVPMGPFYWVLEKLGSPVWVAQRLWMGSLLLLAGAGVLYLYRTLGQRGPGMAIGAVVYMLTPYTLQYSAKHSIIVLPWVALPWMIAIVAKALREGGWKYPAIFAIIVQLVGSVNATALLLAGIGPALWIPYAVWIEREVDWRRALATVARIGGLTLVASLWWMAGLWAQGSYGLDVLRYSETVKTVSKTSTAPDTLRGLGYWFFYGKDKVSLWNDTSLFYTHHLWLIATSFAIPGLAMFGAFFARWRHRVFFIGMTVVGLAVAVGAYPYDDPTVFGSAFKSFAEGSKAGLALRSSSRAAPLVVLGLAILLGAGVNAAVRRLNAMGRPRVSLIGVGLVGALAIANFAPFSGGSFYSSELLRDDVPGYWRDAIAALDKRPHDTRILEIPGSDFTNYRWGGTVEPITPGLTDRPYVARELVPWGSPASANLVDALDRQLQERVLDPAAVPAIAGLIAAGDVVVRDDLAVDRYNLVRARELQALLNPLPSGLDAPTSYSKRIGPKLTLAMLDDRALGLPSSAKAGAPVVVYPVANPDTIVRSDARTGQVVVAGDGEGLVDASALGILDGKGAILYSAPDAKTPKALRRIVGADPDATLLVTDSNRRRAERWTALSEIFGYTERAGEKALKKDTADQRLPLFAGAGDDTRTVVEQRGATVGATTYGDGFGYSPEDRAARAFDGDVTTAWRGAGLAAPAGERIVVDTDAPITTDHVNLVQPLTGPRAEFITRATLRFDGGAPISVDLGDPSRTPEGQTVTFPRHTFRQLEITIDTTNFAGSTGTTRNSVGFAEIRLRDDAAGATDVRIDEVVRMPVDLGDAVGAGSADRRLVFLMSRSRTAVVEPRLGQDELTLARELRVPTARDFGVRGQARLSTQSPDDVIDVLLGLPSATDGGITARSSARLPGSVEARASSAIDANPSTAWTTPFGDPVGQWAEVALPGPTTVDHLDLRVVADGRHSVPTQIRVDAGGQSRTVDLPAIADGKPKNATTLVPVSFAPLTGATIRVTVTAARAEITRDYFTNNPIQTPIAIAELGIPGVVRPALPSQIDTGCRSDLLSVDGTPEPMRIVGDHTAAVELRALDLEPCAPGSDGIALAAGQHLVRSADGRSTGLDVDGLTLASAAGGQALALGAGGSVTPSATTAPPKVKVVDDGQTKMHLKVTDADAPFWLVLGQSQNAGWRATVDGKDLGESTLVDGYANGWRVTPHGGGTTIDVTLEWTPQRVVWGALAVSGIALLVCLALAFGLRRRKSRGAAKAPVPSDEPTLASFRSPDGERAGSRHLGRVALIAGTAAVAVSGLVVARWWVGLIAAVAFAVAAARPRLRWILGVGALAAVAAVAAFILVQQLRIGYDQLLEWPSYFNRVHMIGWLAAVLLGADALLEILQRRSGSPNRGNQADEIAPAGKPDAAVMPS
jgi:arabinofuranan 3-O-arabinosyltransferase